MFNDRADAGERLAHKLAAYRGASAVVVALPRGGVAVGAPLARALRLPLDIVVVRKIGHKDNPEYALGAVSPEGTVLIDTQDKVNQAWLEREIKKEQKEALRRLTVYRDGRKPLELRGKVVILVDDGIATGLSMRLAVRNVRVQKPARVVVAVPVAPGGVIRTLSAEGADEVVVAEPPEEFAGAVGAHYRHFEQVEDAQVLSLLKAGT